MKNGLGHNVNAGLTHRVLRKATCSVHGSPASWRDESVSTDFHELRQEFNPPIQK